jgi:pimeloyl-ACP methyl ester carboxylesterase
MRRSLAVLTVSLTLVSQATSQTSPTEPQPPGRFIDLGGYRLHLWCTGAATPNRPTVILSAGGGDFATDWSLVQRSLADSVRVCSYDRPGFGWSDPGPYPRTLRQEAFEVRSGLAKAGELPPYVLVGHSIGSFVARSFAETYRKDVVGMVLVGPTNENGKLGYRGQWVIPRLLATDRPVPPVQSFADGPPALTPSRRG